MSLRPSGVTWIAILFLIIAALGVILGILCLGFGNIVKTFWDANIGPRLAGLPLLGDRLFEISPASVMRTGIVGLIFGVLSLITGFGLLKLTKWGYWLAILVSIPLIILILGIIFIWYLRKDEVKAAFDIT